MLPFKNFTAVDALAIILLIGYLFLAYNGQDQVLLPAVTLMIGFYFGKEHQRTVDNSK